MKTLKFILALLAAISSVYFVFDDKMVLSCYLLLVGIFLLILPEQA